MAAIPSPQQPPPASLEHQVSTQHEQQASSKQPATKSLSECGFIPAQKNAALLLAKTSDGPPTL